MSAFFDFSSLITVLLLMICTCTYLRELRPTIFDHFSLIAPSQQAGGSNNNTGGGPNTGGQAPNQQPEQQQNGPLKREGLAGFLWKLSRIGERLSPYVGVGCAMMALHVLFFK